MNFVSHSGNITISDLIAGRIFVTSHHTVIRKQTISRFSHMPELIKLLLGHLMSEQYVAVYLKTIERLLTWMLAGLVYVLAVEIVFRNRSKVVAGLKKYVFSIGNREAHQVDDVSRAVIYGVDNKAVSLVTALRMDESCKFKFVAFLGNSPQKTKSIFDIPIVSTKSSLSSTLQALQASVLIFATDKLSQCEKFEIVEDCAKNKIKIFIPSLISQGGNELSFSSKLRDLRIEDLLYRKPEDLEMGYLTAALRKKTVLVTGGAGSIGSELVLQLASLGAKEIIVFDIAESPLHDLEIKILGLFPGIKFQSIIGDVTRTEDVRNVFMEYKPHFVYHAAAYKHEPMMEKHPGQAIKTNVLGTKNVADLAIEFHAQRFVLISTDKAVNPTSIMGATKRVAELYIQELSFQQRSLNGSATRFVTTRFGDVIGSNGSVVPLFIRQISEGGPVTVTHKDITRYFMTIQEACQLVLIAGCKGEGGDIFLFDMGKRIKVEDLATWMIQLAGLEPHKDIEVKFTGLRPGEKLYEELHSNSAIVTPTDNPKILKVIEVNCHSDEFHAIIDALCIRLHTKSAYHFINQLKNLVPEYSL